MLRIIKIPSAVLLCLLLSCSGNGHIKVPAGIMQPDSMAAMLTDLHILQASAQMGFSQNTTDTSITQAYHSLWLKHRLTEQTYNQNIQFYSDHPKLLDSVYEKVLNNLNQQKAELMGNKHIPGK